MSYQIDSESLKLWFQMSKRSLPWRGENLNPYHVWVSEVMLQQTQVAVVIRYFERWIESFPTIETLAKAPIEQVIKLWEGLGYYARARNLHAGAQFVLLHFNGNLPSDADSLKKIKGLGPYTVAAIQAFAFRKKAAPVDGNVLRVLSRYFLFDEDLSKAKNIKKMFNLAEEILPEEESWVFSEALIELGATICTKKGSCLECPIRTGCGAYAQQRVSSLPFKSKKQKIEKLYRSVAIVLSGDKVLIGKESEEKVMKDLYQFPYYEQKSDQLCKSDFVADVKGLLGGVPVQFVEKLPKTTHSYTRYSVELFPYLFEVKETLPVLGYEWLLISEADKKPFSSGHRKLLNSLSLRSLFQNLS